MKVIYLTACTSLTLFSASCNDPSNLKLLNGTTDQIRELSITDGKTIWKLADLEPEEYVMLKQPLYGEGSPTVSWTWRGKRRSDVGCYYTGGMPAQGSVTIAGDHLEFLCD